MYWTHLIFALTLGILHCYGLITAVKAGYLDFDNLPETNFSCKNKVIGGYYADVETGCQMFHVCTIGQKGTDPAQSEVTDIKFLCLNGTVFDQETRVCERIDEVDCSKSEDFFNLNLELYGNQAGGIQPEEEFFCEDCSTEEDDYDLSPEVTTRSAPTSTTTTTTTTTPRPTTTATSAAPPTPKVGQHYQTNSPETIAALLALHNAFSQSVQNPKVKPPPPRVINNAFAGLTSSTPKPSYYGRPQVTQLPPIEDSYDDPDQEDPRLSEEDHRLHQEDHRLHQEDHRIRQDVLRIQQEDQRIRQDDQRIRQDDHRIRQDDHRIRQDDQRVRQDEQRIRQDEHRIRQEDPRVRQDDPRVRQDDPRVRQDDPRVRQDDPRVRQEDPRVRQDDPRVRQDDPRVRQDDPRVRQDDPRVRQDDPRVRQDEREEIHRYAPLGGHGALTASLKDRHKTNFYQVTTPANLKSNYHHFQSGDSTFLHSFDTGKQYNYQYFHPRKIPEPTPKASVSIVTSTSTSTSVRAVKPNVTTHEHDDPSVHVPTAPDDFPTGYDDYPDDSVDDAFFRDVPKIRTKRSTPAPRHANHKYPDETTVETTTSRHQNHRYEENSTRTARLLPDETPSRREQFLQNLLGSLDMEEHDRQKMATFFKVEEKEMDASTGLLHQLGNKLGELIMDDVNKTIHQAKTEQKNATDQKLDLDKINQLWQHHYEEMSQEVDLKFDVETERNKRDAEKQEKLMEELAQDYELAKHKIELAVPSKMDEIPAKLEPHRNATKRSRVKRQVKGLDTEKFTADHEPRRRARTRLTSERSTARTNVVSIKDVVPVFEEVDEGDFTTRPYLRTSDRTSRPRLTTRSVDSTASRPRFNYEITTPAALPSFRRRNQNHQRSSLVAEQAPPIPRLAAVPNVTRDVSKLKDVPVYEEEYDSGEVANVQVPFRQEFTQSPRPIELSNGQFPVHAYVSTPSTPSFLSSEYFPQEASDERSQTTEPLQHATQPPPTPSRTQSRRQQTRKRLQASTRSDQLSRQSDDQNSPRRASQDRRFLARQKLRPQPLETPSENERVFETRTRAPLREVAKLRNVQNYEPEYDSGDVANVPVSFRPEYAPSSRVQQSVDGQFPASGHLSSPSPPVFPPLEHIPQDESAEPISTTEPAQTTTHPSPVPSRKQVRIVGRARSRGAARPKPTPRDDVQIPSRAPDERRTQARHRLRPQTETPPEDERYFEARTNGPPREHETVAENPEPPKRTKVASRGSVRGTLRSTTPPNEPPPAPPMDPSLVPDPKFSCDGKIKGSFYADVSNDCKGFFICSQGQIDGPLLKSHFWCGTSTKFNQRSRTCQAEDLVQCEVSSRYYHLNQDFAIPETEEQLKPTFEPQRTQG